MRVVVTQYFASAVNATVNWFLLCYNLALIFLSGIKKNFFKENVVAVPLWLGSGGCGASDIVTSTGDILVCPYAASW